MTKRTKLTTAAFLTLAMFAGLGSRADAAQCGNGPGGFEAWKSQFAQEARAKGVGAAGISALMGTTYAGATINADRSLRSFKLSLDQFLAKRGAPAIVARGRSLKRSQAALFASIEARYGVPAGPLIAIWGMESGFGSQRGNQNMLSSIATLAYDCRRPEFFTEQLYAALKLVDRGALSASSVGAAHGEIGHTQFLPGNVLKYGVGSGNLRDKATALASTANFLKAHGWRRGASAADNIGAIAGWNDANVYQQAIVQIATAIDGD